MGEDPNIILYRSLHTRVRANVISSGAPLACISKNSKHLLRSEVSWRDPTKLRVERVDLYPHQSACLVSRIFKRNHSEVRVYAGTAFGHPGRRPLATCRFSTKTKKSFDHQVKEMMKKSFEKWKTLNILKGLWVKLMKTLFTVHATMSVLCMQRCLYCACNDVCTVHATMSVLCMQRCLCETCNHDVGKEMFARTMLRIAPTRTPCVSQFIASIRWGEVTSNNHLWSPQAYGLRGQ